MNTHHKDVFFTRASIGAGLLLAGLVATPAWAVPAFTAQTDQPCRACHIGGFGAQLTPLGRRFKLEGFTMNSGTAFPVPVSAEVVSSFVNTKAPQESPPADHYATNNNFSLDHASLFVAGGIGDHFGGLIQMTYDGVGRSFAWDMFDVRATDHVTISGNDVLLGVSVTNNPGLADVWNTMPAWSFPYTTTSLAPTPAASTILDGQLTYRVLGATTYAYWNSNIYTEVTFYWTPSKGFLSAMGTDFGPGPISGAAPYFCVNYSKDYGDQNFEIGAFGFFPRINPNGDFSTGKTNSYSDVGLEASYQFMGDGSDIYTVNARYTHESQNLRASYLQGDAANLHDSLDDFRVDASYYWNNVLGGTVRLFNTTGSSDALLYADSRTSAPDSSGIMFQIDATPWGTDAPPLDNRLSVRVGVQYTIYTKFNGAGRNYDGTGRTASDNNTLRIFTWLNL